VYSATRSLTRAASAPGELGADRLVRDDHQLLHQRVRMRLALHPGPLDSPLSIEGELDLPGLDP
jgi:hypothetical protein